MIPVLYVDPKVHERRSDVPLAQKKSAAEYHSLDQMILDPTYGRTQWCSQTKDNLETFLWHGDRVLYHARNNSLGKSHDVQLSNG
ncbi:hypothetical protein [Nostoc sp.]|uniref:hypothetical protein n=1 Tax=Nostoc sp. TaxID=1180 RepID=UPI002FF6C9C0